MTTLELYRKHKKGEIGRDRFLYEVRRDNNLPWITNITSYDDAVKILKNKGIIREAQFEPQNIPTDPLVDRVNPYALKREVEKLLAKEPELTNDSYKRALNKAAKKLTTPEGVKKSMFANADSVAKADAKLQTQEVKKANYKDKHNEMKKAKGQQTPKATAAPTKENKKTKKPKGVKVMPDKGVEGSQKIIKEISSYIKKKLTENSAYSGFHEGMVVPTPHGEGTIKDIVGGTLGVQCEDGKLYDVQMNVVSELMKQAKEQAEQRESIDVRALGGHEGGMKLANKLIDAIEMYNSLDPEQKQAEIERLKSNIPAELRAKFDELMAALHDEDNYPPQEEDEYLQENDIDGLDYEEEREEKYRVGNIVQIDAPNDFDKLIGIVDAVYPQNLVVRFKQQDIEDIGADYDEAIFSKADVKKLAEDSEEYLENYGESWEEDELEETASGAIVSTDTGVQVATADNSSEADKKALILKRELPKVGTLTITDLTTGIRRKK